MPSVASGGLLSTAGATADMARKRDQLKGNTLPSPFSRLKGSILLHSQPHFPQREHPLLETPQGKGGSSWSDPKSQETGETPKQAKFR